MRHNRLSAWDTRFGAVLFDLDDTLYPGRRFAISGFAAVARELARVRRCDPVATFACLVHAFRSPNRGRELQTCLATFNLPPELVEALVEVIRGHVPSLRLPRSSRDVLAWMRPRWRLGIVTNGQEAVQRRKVQALGLNSLVDTIVFAGSRGAPGAKPAAAPFLEAARRLQVEPYDTVFVGDDEWSDINGAARAGMTTIRVAPRWPASFGSRANAVIGSMRELPFVLEDLPHPRRRRQDVA